ncbi:ABC transporter ATP-binding protein [Cohnella sp. REN36]|uniref:ABC transporter ATP-binding protein n=1 Tax=Cohnella sp. REN36 TaxID=2887347 RepID=UPI00351D734F
MLRSVSLSMKEGECLAIVGESGSGKSTLAKLILGLEAPDEGRIRFMGIDMHTASRRQIHAIRRQLQGVFQNSGDALNPRMTAGKIVTEPLRNYERLDSAEMRQRQHDLLCSVGLSPKGSGKYPHQFSGGQQQRLNIARALALSPKLIVLDEVVSSQDPAIQLRLLELLHDLKIRLGLSYLFITHDIRAAVFLADRLIVMDRGCVVEHTDIPRELEGLRHPASRKLLDALLPDGIGDG